MQYIKHDFAKNFMNAAGSEDKAMAKDLILFEIADVIKGRKPAVIGVLQKSGVKISNKADDKEVIDRLVENIDKGTIVIDLAKLVSENVSLDKLNMNGQKQFAALTRKIMEPGAMLYGDGEGGASLMDKLGGFFGGKGGEAAAQGAASTAAGAASGGVVGAVAGAIGSIFGFAQSKTEQKTQQQAAKTQLYQTLLGKTPSKSKAGTWIAVGVVVVVLAVTAFFVFKPKAQA